MNMGYLKRFCRFVLNFPILDAGLIQPVGQHLTSHLTETKRDGVANLGILFGRCSADFPIIGKFLDTCIFP